MSGPGLGGPGMDGPGPDGAVGGEVAAADLAANVAANVEAVNARLRAAGAEPEAIVLIAVTKGFGPEIAAAALAAGLVDLGENYAQDLVAKARMLPGPRWHMIGNVQRNKVASLAPHVHLWQTVDRPGLVDEIARRAPGAQVLLQVNAGAERQKGGITPTVDAVGALADHAFGAGLAVRGLLAVGVADDAHATATAFAATRRLVDHFGFPVCSMGMTADLEIAVREGTTMVRVGRQLFGARPPRPAAI